MACVLLDQRELLAKILEALTSGSDVVTTGR
jgi:hypothetical protein